jgi:hypothetical protein
MALFIQVYTHNIGQPCGLSIHLHEVLITKGVAAHIISLFAVYLVGHCLRHWK